LLSHIGNAAYTESYYFGTISLYKWSFGHC